MYFFSVSSTRSPAAGRGIACWEETRRLWRTLPAGRGGLSEPSVSLGILVVLGRASNAGTQSEDRLFSGRPFSAHLPSERRVYEAFWRAGSADSCSGMIEADGESPTLAGKGWREHGRLRLGSVSEGAEGHASLAVKPGVTCRCRPHEMRAGDTCHVTAVCG